MGYDHVKLLAGVYDELNCFRHLVALYFLCEKAFLLNKLKILNELRDLTLAGAETFIFLEKKGKEIN